jgi:tetratricopeptide (TPR) repeat protein
VSEVEMVLDRALGLGEEGRWEEMAQELRSALTEHAEEPAVHCWLGVAERELGMEGIAYERFKAALALQPEDPYVLATAGTGIAAFDDPDAESALRAAAMLGPDVALARWMYGAYLSREGLVQDALRELEAARELDPDDPAAVLETGVANALAEDWKKAAAFMAEAVTLAPEDGWPRILLGLVHLEVGDSEDADAELEAGARLRPDDLEAQLLSALAAAAAGREGVAYEMLERARMQGVEGVDALLAGEVEERIDDGAEAAGAFLSGELAPGALRERLMARP